ncbi:alcohol dehydrogenase catalytic domain-containing protein [Streptomyces profundus]|uniref:alcohol dehydrogenase catalytic domain-containing protein n=1 Tax=Streptomyces profundus TaxID=2867410 RepID=UPI001D15FF3C|nr:alcohol dehydrogenase catalytic domain-containing protein [Streptomyces sp. MA3_2.13]UED82773.1 alcohol dehydrogenase catalytic domain-containing protein [Streptomyces sp. MA3_2.13]
MRAVVFDAFGHLPEVREVPDPAVPDTGVVVRVAATGLCRSDWHGWMGHDQDIALPHVPGHELAGRIEAVGPGVTRWHVGDRVTVPFVQACGRCPTCAAGDHQICERQRQPGFTGWGSFADRVALHHADVNLVALPDTMDWTTAAGLGCRFATAHRAVVAQGQVRAGTWVAVHGCGGVGLSAVMIAVAAGALVVAIDTQPEALALAAELGAAVCLDAAAPPEELAEAVRTATGGGAHLSLDAIGSPTSCATSVQGLRRRGRHVQVGLLPHGAPIPMDRVIALELAILGSHGMAAHAYPEMMRQITAGTLRPDRLVRSVIPLDAAPAALAALTDGTTPGATVITLE